MSLLYQPLEPPKYQQFLDWRDRGDAHTLGVLQKELLRLEVNPESAARVLAKG